MFRGIGGGEGEDAEQVAAEELRVEREALATEDHE
jgi:hypothetical protein